MVHASPEGILLRQLAEQDGSNYFSGWITLEDFPKLSLAGTRSLIFLGSGAVDPPYFSANGK